MADDAIAAFIDAMEAAGLVPAEPIAQRLGSGELVRFQCQGDSKGRRNGWAKLHLDARPAGSFGSHKLGLVQSWRLSSARSLSPAERQRLARECQQAAARREVERQAQWEKAADACRADWGRASPADPKHPYLVRKGIVGEGLRQLGNRLLVPMCDAAGLLWNFQRIAPDGGKLYAKDARAAGLFMVLGAPVHRLAIAEGYGTGAVIRRATGWSVVIAFTWKSLRPAAVAMRERFPAADIVIAADDDAHLVDHPVIKRNLGLDAARDAAQAIGARVAVPPRSNLP